MALSVGDAHDGEYEDDELRPDEEHEEDVAICPTWAFESKRSMLLGLLFESPPLPKLDGFSLYGDEEAEQEDDGVLDDDDDVDDVDEDESEAFVVVSKLVVVVKSKFFFRSKQCELLCSSVKSFLADETS